MILLNIDYKKSIFFAFRIEINPKTTSLDLQEKELFVFLYFILFCVTVI